MTLRELLRLSPRGRQLLVRALFVVVAMRLSLWLLPFPRVQRLAHRIGRRSPRAVQPLTPAQLESRVWAVRQVSRLVPRATCLTQALATQVLLGRVGQASQVRLGVQRSGKGRLEAHAWLESDGQVVIGDGALERYISLPALEKIAS